MRIVSFLPSATELLYELGVQDSIVGVTHECTYPEAAREKPRMIRSVFDPEKMTPIQIDEAVSRLARKDESLFIIEEEALKDADPDIIIGQGTCAVCSAYTREISLAMQILNQKPRVEVLDPHSIEDILADVTLVAEMVGRPEEGKRLRDTLERRISVVKALNFGTKPSVLCIEWVEPFFTSGHWVPQMVEIAGGRNLASSTGEHSRRITMEDVEGLDPDIIVMMPCGFDVQRTSTECTSILAQNPRWQGLRAVREGRAYAVDANAYFSKPSIRTVTGIEVLAKIIYPDEHSGPDVPKDSFRRI